MGLADKPVTRFEQEELNYSTATGKMRKVMENYPYVAHLVGGSSISTAGIQYTTATVGSTSISTKSSNYKTALSSTISWPGLEGKNIDELEFGLTAEFRSTLASSNASTVGFLWQFKNSTGSTWRNLHTPKTLKSTGWGSRTMSGYRLHRDSGLAAGYNKLPINIRLRFYNKTASKGSARVKSSSYIAIKTR